MIDLKISACVITKNEEKNIRNYLRCLKPYVQEIIMLDTGSTDKTEMIARQENIKVHHYRWQNDFAAAKNFALSKASGDWIVFLDADEFFSPDTVGNLSKLIAMYENQYDVLLTKMINIDTFNQNKILDTFYTVRVFRRLPMLIYEGKIHEQLVRTDKKELRFKTMGEHELLLYHTGYSADKIAMKAKRNLKMIWDEMEKSEHKENYYVYLAEAYAGIDDDKNAAYYATLDIDSGRKNITYASRSHRILIESLKNMKVPGKDLQTAIEKAVRDFPEMPDFYAEYGLFFYERQNYINAAHYFKKALTLHAGYDKIEPSLLENSLPLLQKLLISAEEKRLAAIRENNENKQEITEMDNSFVNEKDQEIYRDSILKIATKIQLFTITILLSEIDKELEWKNEIPIGLHRLIERYFGKVDKLGDDDIDGYCSMLGAIINFNELGLLKKYLQIGMDFAQEEQLKIIKILAAKKYFSEMMIFLPSLTENDFCDQCLCYWAGIAYYKEKKYDRAEFYFQRAMALGSVEGDIDSYLTWIQEGR